MRTGPAGSVESSYQASHEPPNYSKFTQDCFQPDHVLIPTDQIPLDVSATYDLSLN